jgi:hypothetical protein
MADFIADGFYLGTVTEHGYGEPKPGKSGSDYLFVAFDLETLDTHEPVGSLTAFLHFTERSVNGTLEQIRNIGYQGDDTDFNNKPLMIGMRAQVQVKNESFENGPKRSRIKWIYSENYKPGPLKSDVSANRNQAMFATLLKTKPSRKTNDDDPVPF